MEVQGLHQPLHSGLNGPVPDPVQILCAMIADLRKPNGALNVPGLYAKVARPSAKQLARIRKLPLSEAKFKKDSGMLPGVRLWGERQFSLLERMWTRPALTVIALEARPFLGSSNQIIEAARARLSLRTTRSRTPRAGSSWQSRSDWRSLPSPTSDGSPSAWFSGSVRSSTSCGRSASSR